MRLRLALDGSLRHGLVGDWADRDSNKAVKKFSGRASQQTGTESILKRSALLIPYMLPGVLQQAIQEGGLWCHFISK
jgi:hypothetical protein